MWLLRFELMNVRFQNQLPVNRLTWKKKKKVLHITNLFVYMIQKSVCRYLLWPPRNHADKGGLH
jgi:hypothetical protein